MVINQIIAKGVENEKINFFLKIKLFMFKGIQYFNTDHFKAKLLTLKNVSPLSTITENKTHYFQRMRTTTGFCLHSLKLDPRRIEPSSFTSKNNKQFD